MKTILLILLAFSLSIPARAQSAIQAVWITNAHRYAVSSIDLAGDAMSVASCSLDRTAYVWRAADGALVRGFGFSGGGPLSVALSASGAYLGVGFGAGSSRMYRVRDGVRLWLAGSNEGEDIINTVAFSPDDLWFADATWGRWSIINRHSGNGSGGDLAGHSATVSQITYSPDSTILASAGSDGQVFLWAIPAGNILRTLPHPTPVSAVDFSADGSVLATGGGDATTRLWNVTSGAPLLAISNTGGLVKFLGDGRYLMTLDGQYQFQIFRTSDGHYMGGYTNTAATCFAVARDGRYFAYGTTTGSVVLAYSPLIHEGFTREHRRTFMHWWGGSGYYQVQRRSKERGHKWRNWGQPTTNTTTRVIDRPHFAYRILSLPPP